MNINFVKILLIAISMLPSIAQATCASDEVLGLTTGSCLKRTGTCGTNCTYTIDEQGKLVVSGPTASGQSGVINGYGRGFMENADITSIEITGHISQIQGQAFGSMPNVTSIKIGDGVQTIDGYAFAGNSASNLSIGKVQQIGYASFHNMSNLTSVTFADGNPVISTYAFSSSGSSEGVSIVLPEGLTKLENYALGQISNVKSVVLPDSLTEIGYSPFFNIEPEVIFCNNTTERSCSDILRNKGLRSTPVVQEYLKEEGMYVITDGDNKIYFSSALNMATNTACTNTDTTEGLNLCRASAIQNKGKCNSTQECLNIIEQADSGKFFVTGKFYASINDWLSGDHIKKRIYTVEEAESVSGKKNTFKIRYK